jgi:[ribosomal protein S5]-alanine N-acetyltransferase
VEDAGGLGQWEEVAAVPPRQAPARIETPRLVLRRPQAADAEAIFRGYASDAEVTRYVGFPRHTCLDETRGFLEFSDAQWAQWPAGPYLIELREGPLVGSSGLKFDTANEAATGYVLAKHVWGRGYATESLLAMVDVARACGVRVLYALCHHAHRASARVLEKGGFSLERRLPRYAEFPNLVAGERADVLRYVRILENLSGTEEKMRS